MDKTDHLSLPYLMASQAQKHVTHNEALRMLDVIVQLSVSNRSETSRPSNPSNGDRYIVGENASGDWADYAGKIAAYQDDMWLYYAPEKGWRVWIDDEALLAIWNGTSWIENGGGQGTSNITYSDFLGINAQANANNRLSISAPTSLFSHEGDSHRLKINKAAISDTASLIFQSGFSGRAELGAIGDDDFQIKVSADGENWKKSIVIDKNTGEVSLPNTVLAGGVSGTDVKTIVLEQGSGTYTPGQGAHSLRVICVGAGGGGAGAYISNGSTYCSAGGGGAAGVVIKTISYASMAQNYTYSVGIAGVGGTADTSASIGSRNGGAGTATTFSDGNGIDLFAGGGNGAPEDQPTSGATEFIGGVGGTAIGGDINLNGGKGFGGVTNGPNKAQNGVGNGANTILGVGGAVNNGNGTSGTGYGAGGAGAGMIAGYSGSLNRKGGNGAPAIIIIEEYY